MNFKTFFINNKQKHFNIIRIQGGDFHHIVNVLKLPLNHQILVKDFNGNTYTCCISNINLKSLYVEVIIKSQTKSTYSSPFSCPIGLFLSIPRLEVLASIVKKITEIGVDFLQLIITERSFVKSSQKINLTRFNRISTESLKQCGRQLPLNILPPISLEKLANHSSITAKNPLNIFPFEGSQTPFSMQFQHKKDYSAINLFIGCEGGINHQEANFINSLGFQSISLGNNILKVETAVIFALAKVI